MLLISLFPLGVVLGAAVAVAVTMAYARLTHAGSSWEALRRLTVAVRSLARAVVPLALPVATVGALATNRYSWLAEVVAGVALAALVWFLLRSEGPMRRERHWTAQLLGSGIGTVRALLSWLGARPPVPPPEQPISSPPGVVVVWLAVAFATVLISIVRGGVEQWTSAAGVAGFFVWLGLQLLTVSAFLRLVGYATSPWRWIVVGALALIAVRVAALIGIAPGEAFLARVGLSWPWTVAALAAILVCALAAEAITLAGDTAPPPPLANRALRAGGMVGAFAASLSIGFGMLVAHNQTTSGAKPVDDLVAKTQPVALADVTGGAARQLAWTFAPVLRLHPEEKFPPTSAEDYLMFAGEGCNAVPGGSCTRIGCESCRDPARSDDPALHPNGTVFYARVATTESDPEALAGWVPGDRPLATLLQYWIFYDYNLWEATTVIAELVQEHDADWELVAVGLDRENVPIFLALSSHCGGQVVPWQGQAVLPGRVVGDRVEIVLPTAAQEVPGAERLAATHPIVAVARGSHGNYADDGGRRPPDFGSCKRLPTSAIGTLAYASNVRDETAGGTAGRLHPPNDLELVGSRTYPMSVGVRWGAETLRIGERTFHSLGPTSPPAKAAWRRPIHLFFCDRYWRPYRRAPRASC